MNKLLFYEGLIEELKKRSSTGKIENGVKERGNLAYLCEIYPTEENNRFMEECKALNDNEFCWKVFNALYEDQERQNKEEDEKELDLVLYKGYKLMHSMKKLHDFVCVRNEQYPEWFYPYEKLEKVRKM